MNKISVLAAATLFAITAGISGEEAWEMYASTVHEIVGSEMVEGEPLATPGPVYDPRRRIIHRDVDAAAFPVQLSEREWRTRLADDEYDVIRRAGTERPFTSPLNDVKERGIFYSRATGQPLFHSDDKFDSGTGWPSFTKPITPDAVVYISDTSFFMRRVEVVDSLSGAHLGHVFNDGPGPTGQRYCINGASLIFVPEGEEPPELLVP